MVEVSYRRVGAVSLVVFEAHGDTSFSVERHYNVGTL